MARILYGPHRGNSASSLLIGPKKRMAIDGAFGYAYHFDGVNDEVTAGTNLITTGDGSISFWFQCPDAASSQYLFGTGNPFNGAGVGYAAYAHTNNFTYFLLNDSSGAQFILNTQKPWVINQWHLFTVTLDRDANAVVYIDGVASTAASIAAKSLTLGASLMRLGRYGESGSYGESFMQDWRVYSRVLNGAEVLELYNSGKDALLAEPMEQHFKMIDQNATVAPDDSGNARNGTKVLIDPAVGAFHYVGEDVAFKW